MRLITLLFLSYLCVACDSANNEPVTIEQNQHGKESPIEVLADDYLAAYLLRYPETGSFLSLANAPHDKLMDNSIAALTLWQQKEDRWLSDLEAIGEPETIGSRDWVTYGILHETLISSTSIRICRNELWAASTSTAWHTGVPAVFEVQPVDTAEHRQQALDRLRSLARYIDTEMVNLRLGIKSGYSAPRLTVEKVPSAVRSLLGGDSPLLSPATRANMPVYSRQVNVVFENEIKPAIERFARFLEQEYLPAARTNIALSGNPNGEQCYPELVRYYATVKPTPDQIHQLGLEQILSIRAEMQVIIDEHFKGETIESLMHGLNSNSKYTFSTRDDVLNYALASLESSKQAMPKAFGLLPKADMEIKPYPTYREADGTGEYHSSSEDGTRPGIYYIAVIDPTHRSVAGQQSVLYHEGYPGHHLQGAIALELGDKAHPLARYLYNSGFAEGWALYSERLAGELGLYSGPLDEIGLLSDQAARAARLVVDSGIHTKGWSRQKSLDYMLNNTAWPPVDLESEINRYISYPGQANSYMLGMLNIRRLRNFAEQELGDDFDLRRFHDRVLGNGSITLPMLDQSVTAWVTEQQ
ncbi:MAG: DUF885 domain-containing protein [Porticoccaceae bacterium]|mgnify:FL=1|nr:DUF885 domain-containing protein [Porticoccaceae bacterium]